MATRGCTSSAELVESSVPTLRIPQLEERAEVPPALVAALACGFWCIMASSGATMPGASSLHLLQPDDDIAGQRGFAARSFAAITEDPGAATLVAGVHVNCRMMRRMQLRSLPSRSCGYAVASGASARP